MTSSSRCSPIIKTLRTDGPGTRLPVRSIHDGSRTGETALESLCEESDKKHDGCGTHQVDKKSKGDLTDTWVFCASWFPFCCVCCRHGEVIALGVTHHPTIRNGLAPIRPDL